jgi:FMN-dependent NADH-azoreductase
MAKLLYIEASPRKKRSSSIEIAKVFLDEYRKQHPKDEVAIIDLWKKQLPAFDGDVIDAKYTVMHGKTPSGAQATAWKAVEDVIAEFKNADKYVISLPMWNFNIPYVLKHYIDVLVQPGYTFNVSEKGYTGLMTGKKMLLIYARGGEYGSGTGAEQLEFQKRYMETILQFIGFQNMGAILIEGTGSADKKEKSLASTKEQAIKMAAQY